MEILQLTSQDFGLRPDMEKWTVRLPEHGGAEPERRLPELQGMLSDDLYSHTVGNWFTKGSTHVLAGFCPICWSLASFLLASTVDAECNILGPYKPWDPAFLSVLEILPITGVSTYQVLVYGVSTDL